MSNKEFKKNVLFIQETVKENGEYVVCIAEEGTQGFYKTDWLWGTDKEAVQALCDERNEEQGISKKEALTIILRSMAKK